jgi:hypothetical protein
MTAPITKALVEYIQQELDIEVWDGEVPRFTTTGAAINQNSATTPSSWPVVRAVIQEPGFNRNYTFTNAYLDDGDVLIQVWGTTRAQVQTQVNSLESLLLPTPDVWAEIDVYLGTPFYIVQMELLPYWIGQEEELRLNMSSLLYRGDMRYNVQIHGNSL